jgi:hypothetical protein
MGGRVLSGPTAAKPGDGRASVPYDSSPTAIGSL